MTFALLLSLFLHVLLLFFVRFAAPSWNILSGGASPLNVILDLPPVEADKPSAIAQASQNSNGVAKVGVENNIPTPENVVPAKKFLVETPVADIPNVSIDKEILTVKKSPEVSVVESVPVFQPAKTPSPDIPDNTEKVDTPPPSVAKPVIAAPAPVEKLVSTEPIPGEQQDKIVVAAPVPIQPPPEKPAIIPEPPKPVKVEEPQPVKIEEPKIVKVEEPQPAKTEEPKIVKAEEPQPAKTEEPKPVKIEQPKIAKVEESKPVTVEEPKIVKAEEPKPAKIEAPKPVKVEEPVPPQNVAAAEPKAQTIESGKSDVDIFSEGAPGNKMPSLADIGIASVRKFGSDEGRKIRFGERRKTISVWEKDFRYATYAESVRLKLQRVGLLNYPAAAAKNNLSGTLGVLISIRADGSLAEFGITEPSAYQILNDGAERIVKMSAPFSPLPDNILQETDILTIRINWTFANSSQSLN
ncbi:MAG: TonB family protein [Nitrosomonadales bacterium]